MYCPPRVKMSPRYIRSFSRNLSPRTLDSMAVRAVPCWSHRRWLYFSRRNCPCPERLGSLFAGAPTALDPERDKWAASDSARIVEAIVEARSAGEGFGAWERLFGPGYLYLRGVRRGTPLDSPGSYDKIMSK